MTNDEAQMTKEARNPKKSKRPNDRNWFGHSVIGASCLFRISCFVLRISFVIQASSFVHCHHQGGMLALED
jgi:hypothetical protein